VSPSAFAVSPDLPRRLRLGGDRRYQDDEGEPQDATGLPSAGTARGAQHVPKVEAARFVVKRPGSAGGRPTRVTKRVTNPVRGVPRK